MIFRRRVINTPVRFVPFAECFTLPPPGDSWFEWASSFTNSPQGSPYQLRMIEIWRSGWSEPEAICPRSMAAGMNMAGLYWRPLPSPVLEPECRKEGK
jgi:hypothetical protein